jgi:hypothetical protein
MGNYYEFKGEIILKIAEVAVHNYAGTPEAHVLFKSKTNYLTLPINAVEDMEIVVNEQTKQFIGDGSAHLTIIRCMEQMHGDVNKWAVRTRLRSLAKARHLYFFCMRNATTYSLDRISSIIPGNYNHATVIHGIKAIENEIESGQFDIISQVKSIANALESEGFNKLANRLNKLLDRNDRTRKLLIENREAIA